MAEDWLLALLSPFWQFAIGVCLLATLAVAGVKLAARGPSRMTKAVFALGGLVVALWLLGILLG